MRARSRIREVNAGLLVLLGIVGVTGVLNFLVPDPRAFLNLYYLPVVLGAYLLGRRRGVLWALLACLIVIGLASADESRFIAAAGVTWTRWLDLGTWGGILRHVVPMIAFHHERWDGTGYKGLAGEAIPLGARVIAIADTYDAIVNDRSYRRGRTHAQALVIIREESGRQFDPRVVEAFLATFDEGMDDEERLAA